MSLRCQRHDTAVKQLDRYRYSGHSALMGNRLNEWQAIDAVLPLFGKSVSKARRRYRHFVEQGIALGRRPELIGGGLIRSLGMTAVAVSKLLGISQSAVTRAAYRGEAIAAANSLELVETQNA